MYTVYPRPTSQSTGFCAQHTSSLPGNPILWAPCPILVSDLEVLRVNRKSGLSNKQGTTSIRFLIWPFQPVDGLQTWRISRARGDGAQEQDENFKKGTLAVSACFAPLFSLLQPIVQHRSASSPRYTSPASHVRHLKRLLDGNIRLSSIRRDDLTQ